MAKRKFTPPTEFPAEYVTGGGQKAVLLGRAPVGNYPLIGYILHAEGGLAETDCWTEKGSMFTIEETSKDDLHDIPKRITTWHNVYARGGSSQRLTRREVDRIATDDRLCVYRIERDEDGGNPEIFVEKVEDFKEEV